MNLPVDFERVRLAHKAVRAELLAERTAAGHWPGEVASSPLATATAISALVLAHDTDEGAELTGSASEHASRSDKEALEDILQGHLSEVIIQALHWLAGFQNADGGWGDATRSRSSLAATLLVQAAFRLTGVPANDADLMDRADEYVSAQGGIASLRQSFGKQRLLAASILANCALAGMVPWRQVPTLSFEWACLPTRWAERLRLPINRLEVPSLVAVGQAKFHHDPPRNPLTRMLRNASRSGSLAIVERLQAQDGSFFDAVPLTSFIVMSLASAGRQHHAIVQHGVEFLLSTMRADASWPILPNLAVTNTTSIQSQLGADTIEHDSPITANRTANRTVVANSLAAGGLRPLDAHQTASKSNGWRVPGRGTDALRDTVVYDDTESGLPALRALADHSRPVHVEAGEQHARAESESLDFAGLDWLLDCQSVDAGGWGWSDSPGAIANTDDTAGALIALARWRARAPIAQLDRIDRAARLGVEWLQVAQNADGGWPAFPWGPSALGFDRSAPDLTARALQALAAWQPHMAGVDDRRAVRQPSIPSRIDDAEGRGLTFLNAAQRADGSFTALRFGNEHHSDRENPVCGTSRVLEACAALHVLDTEMATRATRWLVSAQHSNGGWGPPRTPLDYSGAYKSGPHSWRENDVLAQHASVEETSIAVSALAPLAGDHPTAAAAVASGLAWIITAIEQDEHHRPAVIGNYFGNLWYHERLLPLALAAGALSRAIRSIAAQQAVPSKIG